MKIPYSGGRVSRTAVLSHYKPTHQDIYMHRVALSLEKEYTIFGFLMVLMTVLTVLSLIYDIVISVMVENAYADNWEKPCTMVEDECVYVHWQLRLISR